MRQSKVLIRKGFFPQKKLRLEYLQEKSVALAYLGGQARTKRRSFIALTFGRLNTNYSKAHSVSLIMNCTELVAIK